MSPAPWWRLEGRGARTVVGQVRDSSTMYVTVSLMKRSIHLGLLFVLTSRRVELMTPVSRSMSLHAVWARSGGAALRVQAHRSRVSTVSTWALRGLGYLLQKAAVTSDHPSAKVV